MGGPSNLILIGVILEWNLYCIWLHWMKRSNVQQKKGRCLKRQGEGGRAPAFSLLVGDLIPPLLFGHGDIE